MKEKINLISKLAVVIFCSLNVAKSEVTYSIAETMRFVERGIPSAEEKKDEGTKEIKALMELLVPHLPAHLFLNSEEIKDCVRSFGEEILNETVLEMRPLLGGA